MFQSMKLNTTKEIGAQLNFLSFKQGDLPSLFQKDDSSAVMQAHWIVDRLRLMLVVLSFPCFLRRQREWFFQALNLLQIH